MKKIVSILVVFFIILTSSHVYATLSTRAVSFPTREIHVEINNINKRIIEANLLIEYTPDYFKGDKQIEYVRSIDLLQSEEDIIEFTINDFSRIRNIKKSYDFAYAYFMVELKASDGSSKKCKVSDDTTTVSEAKSAGTKIYSEFTEKITIDYVTEEIKRLEEEYAGQNLTDIFGFFIVIMVTVLISKIALSYLFKIKEKKPIIGINLVILGIWNIVRVLLTMLPFGSLGSIIFYGFVLELIVLEIIFTIVEYFVYRAKLKDYTRGKTFSYVALSNLIISITLSLLYNHIIYLV